MVEVFFFWSHHLAVSCGDLKYRFDGKEKMLALGAYPEISLADARQRREEARRQIAHGIDPGAVRKAQKQAETEETETFEVIAREWHTKFTPTWTSGHAATIMSRLERDLFPWIGKRPIAEIKAPELLAVLRRVESRGALEIRTPDPDYCRSGFPVCRLHRKGRA